LPSPRIIVSTPSSLPIASRPQLSQALTDILIRRGSPAIRRKIIDNPDALVSEEGFARVVSAVNGDKSFAAAVARTCQQSCVSGWIGF
jgi:uncharacterized protein (DUF2336 family)